MKYVDTGAITEFYTGLVILWTSFQERTERLSDNFIFHRSKTMKREKIGNRNWRAVGAKGSFFIEQSGRLFWSRYTSTSGLKTFRMPPKQKVSDAKAMCEENQYWEDETKC